MAAVLVLSTMFVGGLGRSDNPTGPANEDTTAPPSASSVPATTGTTAGPTTTQTTAPPVLIRSVTTEQAFVCVAGAPRSTIVEAAVEARAAVEVVRLRTLAGTSPTTLPARTMERISGGTYRATAGPFPTPGPYRLEVEVVTVGGQSFRAEAGKPLEVRPQCSVD